MKIKTVIIAACTITPAIAGIPPMDEMRMPNNPFDMATMVSPGLAPLNIMTGCAGGWMISYQFMLDRMDGNLSGSADVSTAQILRHFNFAPLNMTMQMHMLMVMYAPLDQLNFTVSVPYLVKDMDMLPRDGRRFTEHSDGFGDVEPLGTYTVYRAGVHQLLVKGGLGLPTGSIDASMNGFPLEYIMQLGSGTVSLRPGFTYLGQAIPRGWGTDFNSTVEVGTNRNNYRLGNTYSATGWVARQLTSWASVSIGATAELWENVHGADPRLALDDQPTNDPNRQGGKRLDASMKPCDA
jgi:hypothetical protein